MKIQIECQQCQTKLAVDTAHAGKKGRCPKCKAEFIIPGEEPLPPPPPAAPPEPQAPMSAPTQGAVEEGPKLCPGCDKACDADAVICVNCGYNFKTGKQLQTEVEEAPEEEEPGEYEEEPPE